METENTPISHDGWKSRRAIGSSIASGVIFLVATVLAVWSSYRAVPFFSSDAWKDALWVSCTVLAFGWGYMSFDKYLELRRLTSGKK